MVALIVLVVVFGAIVAALVPIGMAHRRDRRRARPRRRSIGQIVEFNLFVTNMVSMIGLAVGIDYSLFIVSRFREERKKGFDKLEAIGAAGRHGEPGRVLQRHDGGPRAARACSSSRRRSSAALAAGAIFVTLVVDRRRR